jgi:hypothetical protein
LSLLISLDKFHDGLPFTSINSKEQILTFLNHQYSQKERELVENDWNWIFRSRKYMKSALG